MLGFFLLEKGYVLRDLVGFCFATGSGIFLESLVGFPLSL